MSNQHYGDAEELEKWKAENPEEVAATLAAAAVSREKWAAAKAAKDAARAASEQSEE